MEPIAIIPYLAFAGNCEEAVRTYIDAFGGEILYISRWNKENVRESTEQIGKVMHVEFLLGSTRMAAGDSFDCVGVKSPVKFMVHKESKEDAVKTIDMLSDGGVVVAPLHPHPAPDDDGCGCVVRDRFGYTWIITCPNSDKVRD